VASQPPALCACGSGVPPGACCQPKAAPVVAAVDYPRARIDLRIETKRSEHLPLSAYGPLRVALAMRNPAQLDAQIETTLEALVQAVRTRIKPKQAFPLGDALERLQNALYAARYHERQFLYRWDKLDERTRVDYQRLGIGLSLYHLDVPLTAELTAFVQASRTALDVLGEIVMLVVLDQPKGTFGKMLQHMRKIKPSDPLWRRMLARVMDENEDWIARARQLRDGMVHDGFVRDFRPFGFRGTEVLPAELEGRDAHAVVRSLWQRHIQFIRDCADAFAEELHGTEDPN